MQDIASDYRRKMADAVTTVMQTVKAAVEEFDETLLEAETEFTAATNVRMRMFQGEDGAAAAAPGAGEPK